MLHCTDSKPRRSTLLCLAIGLIHLVVFSGCKPPKPADSQTPPQRIIAMAPSVTEILFELGLGDRIIAVGQMCNYPEAAQKLPRVGGLYDPDIEQIIEMDPDLIIMLKGQGDQARKLEQLGLPVFLVDHRSIQGILDSFKTIANRCGVPKEGEQLAKELSERLDRLRKKTAGLDKPRTLICIQRSLGAGRLESLCVAGKSPFFNEALSIAGGENVMADSLGDFPNISIEGVLQTDPEVIFDISPAMLPSIKNREKAMSDWQEADVRAVRDHRVYLISEDYAMVPGPRFFLFLEKLAELLHEK